MSHFQYSVNYYSPYATMTDLLESTLLSRILIKLTPRLLSLLMQCKTYMTYLQTIYFIQLHTCCISLYP